MSATDLAAGSDPSALGTVSVHTPSAVLPGLSELEPPPPAVGNGASARPQIDRRVSAGVGAGSRSNRGSMQLNRESYNSSRQLPGAVATCSRAIFARPAPSSAGHRDPPGFYASDAEFADKYLSDSMGGRGSAGARGSKPMTPTYLAIEAAASSVPFNMSGLSSRAYSKSVGGPPPCLRRAICLFHLSTTPSASSTCRLAHLPLPFVDHTICLSARRTCRRPRDPVTPSARSPSEGYGWTK